MWEFEVKTTIQFQFSRFPHAGKRKQAWVRGQVITTDGFHWIQFAFKAGNTMYYYIIKASYYAIFEKLDLLCVELGQVLVEELPDVLHHGGACDLRDAGGLWGVGIVEGILHQATLTPIQVLHLLLAHHDFLETGEKGRRKGREVGK